MNSVPPPPWVVTTPDKVRPDSIVSPAVTSQTDVELLTSLMLRNPYNWCELSTAKEWIKKEVPRCPPGRRAVVVCTITDLLVIYVRDASRFPRACSLCGRGVYESAFFVEHDGPCGGKP